MSVSVESSKPRRLRADAERNRQAILDAATTLFAQRGLSVSTDEVASAAKVGIGTLYRHFPAKQDLINGVFDQQLQTVTDAALRALDADDPWEGITRMFSELCETAAADRGMCEVMTDADDQCVASTRARETITPLFERIVERAHAAGQLRPGVDANDFVVLMSMMRGAVEMTAVMPEQKWRRYCQLLLDGVHGSPGDEPLIGSAPTDDEIAAAKAAFAERAGVK
jgi:AcrR family transcriptional regulator